MKLPGSRQSVKKPFGIGKTTPSSMILPHRYQTLFTRRITRGGVLPEDCNLDNIDTNREEEDEEDEEEYSDEAEEEEEEEEQEQEEDTEDGDEYGEDYDEEASSGHGNENSY